MCRLTIAPIHYFAISGNTISPGWDAAAVIHWAYMYTPTLPHQNMMFFDGLTNHCRGFVFIRCVVGVPLSCCLFCVWPMLHDYSLDYKGVQPHDINMFCACRKIEYNVCGVWRRSTLFLTLNHYIVCILACHEESLWLVHKERSGRLLNDADDDTGNDDGDDDE